jgi:DNA primase
VRLLGRYARKIIVNFDPDAAGVAATKRSLEMLLSEGFKVNVLTLPDNLDPDEFIRARGADGYYKLLKHSQNFLDYIVAQAISANDQSRPTGKVETINAILPYLRLVKDRIERAEQFERIADQVKIDSRLIREEFKKAAETRQERVSERTITASIVVKPAERRLLEILLSFPNLRRRLSGQMREEDYVGLRTERLFQKLFEFEQQGIEPTYAALTDALEDEELARDLLPQLMITDFDANSSSQASLEQVEQDAIESLYSLREKSLGDKTQTLQAEIKEAQRAQASTDDLMMQKLELAKQKFKGSLIDRSNEG